MAKFPDAAFSGKTLLEAYEAEYPAEQTFCVDENIVLRIIGDGTINGTRVIDSKSGRMIQGITSITLLMNNDEYVYPKCHIQFQRFEVDLTPPLETFAHQATLKHKLGEQGFTVPVDNED